MNDERFLPLIKIFPYFSNYTNELLKIRHRRFTATSTSSQLLLESLLMASYQIPGFTCPECPACSACPACPACPAYPDYWRSESTARMVAACLGSAVFGAFFALAYVWAAWRLFWRVRKALSRNG
ncbi:hypothetical protein OIDMADRAFT_35409 [Oidiodendron maius Zn]|uniref:Uncharacterized protein n=1 Tax=Oidiodendron maius (strain Zn) TaxID=913774 RepID=A0A0C3GRH5_OIDMZ|nr:hypothetical protein OIDMADRAFT_35409 [Oidiodendron maius Zn]